MSREKPRAKPPGLSSAVQVYDLAVERGYPIIAELSLSKEDYELQPTLFGEHVRQMKRHTHPDTVHLYVITKDMSRLDIAIKLADGVRRLDWWRIKRLVPRAELVATLYEQHRLLSTYGGVPWGEPYQRLLRSLGTVALYLEEGDAIMGEVMKGLADAQSEGNSRADAMIREMDRQIAAQSAGQKRTSLDNDMELLTVPNPKDYHRSHETVRIECSDGTKIFERHDNTVRSPKQLGVAFQRKPVHGECFTVYRHDSIATPNKPYGFRKMLESRYAVYIRTGEVELFDDPKAAFLRREKLRRAASDQKANTATAIGSHS